MIDLTPSVIVSPTFDLGFSRNVLDDPWVLFHGTSGAFANRIALTGIRRGGALVDARDVRETLDLFRELNWDGEHPGGLGVLNSYSQTEITRPRGRPLCLAESPLRAALYATPDFAGGEAARAVFYALRDLRSLAQNPEARWEPWQGFGPDAEPRTWRDVDREAFRERLGRTNGLFDRIEHFRAAHEYGVIYALRLVPQDLFDMEAHISAGVLCYADLPPERIVETRILPVELESVASQGNDPIRHAWLNRSLRDYMKMAVQWHASTVFKDPAEAHAQLAHVATEFEAPRLTAEQRRSAIDRLLKHVLGEAVQLR